MNATSYNGVDGKDDILSYLEKLSKTELEALLSDHEGIKKLAKNCPDVSVLKCSLLNVYFFS